MTGLCWREPSSIQAIVVGLEDVLTSTVTVLMSVVTMYGDV